MERSAPCATSSTTRSTRYRKPAHLRYKRGRRLARRSAPDEFRRAVEELSLGLRALGVEKGDRVAILSENRPEWAFADLATLCAAAVDVAHLRDPAAAPGALHPERQRGQGALRLQRRRRRARSQEIRAAGDAPAARDPHGRREPRRGHAVARRGARAGPRGAGAGPAGGAPARRRGAAGRPGHAHLHLGHHRRPQGRDAHRTTTSCRT